MIVRRHRNIAVDPRGKIKTGKKSDKGYPMALDHFNLSPFPELTAWYGENAKTLIVYAPSDHIPDMFEDNYALYGGRSEGRDGTKVRSCNGEECVHRINETVEGKTYIAGEITPCICQALPEKHKQRCKYNCYFRAFVANPQSMKVDNPLCYLFETHSINSGAAVMSELEKIYLLSKGRLAMIPFVLSVKMAEGKSNAKEKFPIWTFVCADPTLEALNKRIERTRGVLREPPSHQVTEITMPLIEPTAS